jgi:phosphoglycolate phosphatase
VKPCLIFDLDGTLVDSLPGIAATLNRTLSAHGLPEHQDNIVRGFIGNGLRNLIVRAAPQETDSSLIETMLGVYQQDYQLSWASGTHVYPGIHSMLAHLLAAGFSMSILSNKVHAFTVEMIRVIFPTVPFAAVLGQREGIPHKPHPAGALQISNMISAAPENCVIIGDSTMDIETAINAGMRSIAVSWGYHDRAPLLAAGAGKIIDSPSELPPLLGTKFI